jgi:hypothetical protein
MLRVCVAIIVTCLGISVLGCAPAASGVKSLAAAPVCCGSYSDLASVEWGASTERRLEIDEKSPVFVFDMGRSRFAAVGLPAYAADSDLYIRSHPTALIRFASTFFLPAVTFLDRTRTKIAITIDPAPTIDSHGLLGTTTLLARIPVPTDARYAVIHTPEEVIGSKFSAVGRTASTAFMAGGTFVVIPSMSRNFTWTLGPTGILSLSLAPKI